MRPDERLARLAATQDSVVSRNQILAAGITRNGIDHRRKTGRLHRVYRGVYAVGQPALTFFGDLRAATLAYGDRALVTHRPATVLWEWTEPDEDARDDIDITVIGTKRRKQAGIRLHHLPSLAPADISRRRGIPVTAAPRTLVDFATRATAAELERALNEARIQRRVSDRSLAAAIARAGRHQGAAKLNRLLLAERGPGITRKEMERIFLNLVRKAGLPPPHTNADLLGHERDFYWADHGLVVETDGWETHSTRAAFEEDRRRDAQLTQDGYRVLRFTWRQITEEPERTLATLATTLALRR